MSEAPVQWPIEIFNNEENHFVLLSISEAIGL